MKNQISNRDIELLSAYLDKELNPKEQARLEARLRMEPSLRSYLGELHQNRAALRSLPRLRAPRNFTLTPEAVGIKSKKPTYPVFGLVSALSSLLLILVLVGDFVVSPAITGSQVPAEQPAMLAVTDESGLDLDTFSKEAREEMLSTQTAEGSQAAAEMESATEAEEELRMEAPQAPTEETPIGIETFSFDVPEGTPTPTPEGTSGTASPAAGVIRPTQTPTVPPTATLGSLEETIEAVVLPSPTAIDTQPSTPDIPFIRFVEISLLTITLMSGLAWLYLRTKNT